MSNGNSSDGRAEHVQGTIDHAIEVCRENISRHTWAPVFVFGAAMLLAALIAGILISLANTELEHRNYNVRYVSSNIQQIGSKLNSLEAELAQNRQNIKYVDMSTLSPDIESRKLILAEEKKDLEAKIEALQEKDIEIKRNGMLIQGKPILSDQLIYGAGAILILIIALLNSIYRTHLREISKNEQFKLAFHRIRIAANNANSAGFDSEVRSALTQDAFSAYSEEKNIFKRRKIESPVPGLLSGDLATSIINRVLDEVDIIVKPKKETEQSVMSPKLSSDLATKREQYCPICVP